MLSLRHSRPLYLKYGGRRLLSDVSLPIPAKPKGWPTPWITEGDATNYLFPLYSQGWYIAAVANDRRIVKAAGIACRFTFPNFQPAAEFLKEVFALSETENHHPCWLKVSNSTKNSIVHVCSTTHSALRPAWDPTDTPDSRALEGLTLRDLRFAALISSLPTSPGGPSTELGPSPTRPTWEELEATLRLWTNPPSKKTHPVDSNKNQLPACAACSGPHAIIACPTRHTITPPQPCTICDEPHWRVDCPVRQQAQRNNLTVAQIKQKKFKRIQEDGTSEPPPTPCPVCGGAHWKSDCRVPHEPTQPCPNCGGAHWKADCRVPQAPSELLQRLELSVPSPPIYPVRSEKV